MQRKNLWLRKLRSDATRHLAKELGLWLLIVAALTGVVFLIRFLWLDGTIIGPDTTILGADAAVPGPEESVADTGWAPIVAVLTFPLLLLFAVGTFFRRPFGKKFVRRRYVIRPVQCMRTDSEYNGQAIASRLIFELTRWPTEAKKRSTVPEAASVSVYNVSVPLNWLFNSWARKLTGTKDIVVEPTLIDTEDPMRLVLYVTRSGYVTDFDIGKDPESRIDGLDKTVREAALDLIKELDPATRLAIYWGFEDYDEAIKLIRKQPPTLARDVEIAQLLLESHQLDLAQAQIDAIWNEHVLLTWSRRAEVRLLQAQLYVNVGDYFVARYVLDELLRRRRIRRSKKNETRTLSLLRLLGRCELEDENLEVSLESYERAERLIMRQLRRIIRIHEHAELSECLDHCRLRPNEDVEQCLLELSDVIGEKANCKRMLGEEPFEEYDNQIQVLYVRNSINPGWKDTMKSAQAREYGAYALIRAGETGDALDLLSQAYDAYESSAATCIEETEHDWDFGDLADLAWCVAGKFQCRRKILRNLKPWPENLDRIENDLREVFGLAKELSVDDRNRMIELLSRAMQQSNPQTNDYQKFLAELAVLLTSGVLESADAHDYAKLLQVGRDDSKKSLRPELGDFVARVFERSNLDSISIRLSPDEVREFFRWVFARLRLISQIPGEPIEMLQHRFGLKESVDQLHEHCVEKFQALMDSLHHQAECAYGKACLYAMCCDGTERDTTKLVDEVAAELSKAIELSSGGAGGSSYIGRARANQDFDHLRNYPQIIDVIGEWAPSHPIGEQMENNEIVHRIE